MFLDYLALGLMLFAATTIFYLIIAIHDIPYEIAKRRDHPHLDAIHVAGWVSLLTLHVIWPFLWIWATLYRADRGYGFSAHAARDALLEERLALVEARLAALEQVTVPPSPATTEQEG